jgi:hypothetical protein
MVASPLVRALAASALALAAGACNFLPDNASADSRHVQRQVMTEEELVAANAERQAPPAAAPRAEVELASAETENEAVEPEDEPAAAEAMAENEGPSNKDLPSLDELFSDDEEKALPGL